MVQPYPRSVQRHEEVVEEIRGFLRDLFFLSPGERSH